LTNSLVLTASIPKCCSTTLLMAQSRTDLRAQQASCCRRVRSAKPRRPSFGQFAEGANPYSKRSYSVSCSDRLTCNAEISVSIVQFAFSIAGRRPIFPKLMLAPGFSLRRRNWNSLLLRAARRARGSISFGKIPGPALPMSCPWAST
jgi:hypothetical protein